MFAEFSPLVGITTTPSGINILESFIKNAQGTLIIPEKLNSSSEIKEIKSKKYIQFYEDSLFTYLKENWHLNKAFVFLFSYRCSNTFNCPFIN